MIWSLVNFVVLVGFTLLLPVACIAAWGWGSADERWLMRLALLTLSPLCAALWYAIIGGRRFSYLVQIAIIIGGYAAIFFLLKFHVVTF